jgi:hypothetical protein
VCNACFIDDKEGRQIYNTFCEPKIPDNYMNSIVNATRIYVTQPNHRLSNYYKRLAHSHLLWL